MKLANSALEVLRLATREAHDELEQSLSVSKPSAGKAEYVDYLCALYAWLAPFEERLWSAAWPASVAADARTGKRNWMRADLMHLGLNEAAIDRLASSGPGLNPNPGPNLDLAAARFGLAYVVEGSQLGTQVLGKRLAPVFAPWTPRWLQGYGADTGRNWRVFMACAEQYLDTEERRTQAGKAAVDGFRSLAAYFRNRHSLPTN